MLITKLICGLLESYLKFKTPIGAYCSSIYLKSMLLKVVCLCKFLLRHKSNHFTTAERACVCIIRLIPGIAAKQGFLKVTFICLCILRDTIWYIIKCFKKFFLIMTSICLGSGELNCTQHAYKLNTTYNNCLQSFRTLP